MTAFSLLPAIDLRDGACVRLLKGDFARETRYTVDPLELAMRYAALGARTLHVVDLDGAKLGRPANLGVVGRIAERCALRIQLGGGIRDATSLEDALAVAERVVIGSLAISAPGRVLEWITRYGAERFTLGFDVRLDSDGTPDVTTHGWTRRSGVSLDAALGDFAQAGVRHVLCTDVDKDGALQGPNLALYADCVARWPAIAWQASGGVRDAADLERLATTGVAAAVSGRALLDGRLSDEEIRRFLPNA